MNRLVGKNCFISRLMLKKSRNLRLLLCVKHLCKLRGRKDEGMGARFEDYHFMKAIECQ